MSHLLWCSFQSQGRRSPIKGRACSCTDFALGFIDHDFALASKEVISVSVNLESRSLSNFFGNISLTGSIKAFSQLWPLFCTKEDLSLAPDMEIGYISNADLSFVLPSISSTSISLACSSTCFSEEIELEFKPASLNQKMFLVP